MSNKKDQHRGSVETLGLSDHDDEASNTCTHCNISKPKSKFAPRPTASGVYSWCNDCMSEASRQRRIKNPEAWRLQVVRHRATEAGKESLKRAVYKNIAKSPEKQKARRKLRYAIESGKIIRPNQCNRCNNTYRIEGHHTDYSKPLEVLWLCKHCHMDIHGFSLKSKGLI